jgi:hypothetical protein
LRVVSTRHFKRDGGGLAAANAKRRRAAFTAGPEPDTSIKGNMIAAELRNLPASQNGKRRLDMIAKSLAEGDDSLAAAALYASRFLTGMTQTEQEHVRQQWAQKRQPDALARLKVLEAD